MIHIALALLLAQAPEGPPESPAASTVVRTSESGTEFRQSRTRTQSGNTEVLTETVETRGTDGRLRPSAQTVTETTTVSSDTTQSRQAVYNIDAQGQRRLVESKQIDTQKLAGGGSRSVESTLVPDANGRLSLASRQVQEITPAGAGATQTVKTVFTPDVNAGLRESERVQEIERKVNPNLTQIETTRSVRDGNGRWQTSENRLHEVRTDSPTDRVEEESVRRADANGVMSVVERTVTRHTSSNSQDQQVTEKYSHNIGNVLRRTDNKLDLERRERVTTTKGPNGSRETVREIEGRNPVAPNEPLRVIERIVETITRVAPDQWQTQRQTYTRDGNGRLVLIRTETENSSGK